MFLVGGLSKFRALVGILLERRKRQHQFPKGGFAFDAPVDS